MRYPATIRTSVSQQAITKVTRLFNGTIADVLNELLQNARRAGATAVAIELLDPDGQPTLAVRDDGRGIADPAVLVSLGRSGWDDSILRREDPAGMGVFSLAGRRVEIRSCPFGNTAGWRIVIPAGAWETSAEIPVEPFPVTSGTEILIDMPTARSAQLESAAVAAARFFPLPVTLNGQMLARHDFLKDAVHVERWHGCRIGVHRDEDRLGYDSPRINFHGVTIATKLPVISEVDHGPSWSVMVDIADAPDLQLVLPARKEMVANDALEALRFACRRIIYQVIADQPEHRLSYANWREAGLLGIDLPEATPCLRAWKPRTGEPFGRERGQRTHTQDVILVTDYDADAEQCAAPVLSNIELLGARPVFEQDAFEGYRWYDALPRIRSLHFEIETGGATHQYLPDPVPDDLPSGRVAAITLHLEIAASGRDHDKPTARVFPLDVLVCNNDTYNLDETPILIAEGADVSPGRLAWLLEASLFSPDDDAESDSAETQRERFGQEARNIANQLLLGEEAALLEMLREQLRDNVAWLVPKEKLLTATIARFKVELTLADAPAA